MATSVTADKAFYCLSNRNACIGIALFYLVTTVFDVIIYPTNISESTTLIAFVILLLGNGGLLFGALLENKWLVAVWLVVAILIYIGFPIVILGIIFNVRGYRDGLEFVDVLFMVLEYIVVLVVFSYCTIVVSSYFIHLRNRDFKPSNQLAVTV